jgi:hypothetical protein
VSPQDDSLLSYVLSVLLPNGGYVVALYAAYIDESYDDDFPVFAVGGYLFTVEAAKQMEGEWKAVLKKFDNIPYFHMADVNACEDIFKPLGEKRCDELARKMIALVKKYATFGYVLIANRDTFGGIDLINNDPYTFCLTELLKRLVWWLKENDPGSEMAYFFEAGHPTAEAAWSILNDKFRAAQTPEILKILGPIVAEDRKKVCLLQAADLLVWQATKFVKRRIVSKIRRPRGDFIELMSKWKQHIFVYVDSTSSLYSTFRDAAPHQVNAHLDGWLKLMFRLPPEWEPELGVPAYMGMGKYKVDFGPDLSATPPKRVPPSLDPFWPGRSS